jgi:hypothetical protein
VIVIVVLMTLCHLTLPASSLAKEDSRDTASEAGLGAASVLLSIPYGAVKIAYAILGGITGGFTYALTGGNLKAAESVWDSSLRGTYIITPDHLRGEKPVRFIGVPPENDAPHASLNTSSTDTEPSSYRRPLEADPSAASRMTPSGPGPSIQSGPGSSEINR